jgi:hypothetical protein
MAYVPRDAVIEGLSAAPTSGFAIASLARFWNTLVIFTRACTVGFSFFMLKMQRTANKLQSDGELHVKMDIEVHRIEEVKNSSPKTAFGDVGHVSYTAEEGNRVKRKIDRILLPLLCGCYILSVRGTQRVRIRM